MTKVQNALARTTSLPEEKDLIIRRDLMDAERVILSIVMP